MVVIFLNPKHQILNKNNNLRAMKRAKLEAAAIVTCRYYVDVSLYLAIYVPRFISHKMQLHTINREIA